MSEEAVAVYLDRDGVLNEQVERDGLRVSPRRLEDFKLVPRAAESVRRLRAAGCLALVVTNQPDVARGHLAVHELERMHDLLRGAVAVDDIAVCPHDDADGCACRKPKPGLLEALAAKWAVDPTRSFIVGDSWKDMEAGRRAGCRTILIGRADEGGASADRVATTLSEAVDIIVAELALRGKGADGVHP